MNLILLGINHKTAPVELRECLATDAQAIPGALAAMLAQPGVREAMMVSTCNRVEVLAVAEEPEAAAGVRGVLTHGRPLPPGQLEEALYCHIDQDAVRHLFRVASSLDSLVVGEPQILGQIKEAFRLAADSGSTRTVLNRLLHKTFQVAKRVRSETNIGSAAVSVPFAAVELARKIFDQLTGLHVLLVGAGEMGELAAEHLLANGVSSITVANRTPERAVEMAARWQGRACGLNELANVLGGVDIVITSTGAVLPVITRAMAKAAQKQRRGKPIFFIDIAVPRDVDPKVAGVDGCFVYDIDDLTQVVESNRASRQEEASRAEMIVAEEVVKFNHWLRSLGVVPTIAALSGKAEELRQAELEHTLRQMGELSPEQGERIDALTRALVKKMLHDPILFLKEQGHRSHQTQQNHLALVRRIFNLNNLDDE